MRKYQVNTQSSLAQSGHSSLGRKWQQLLMKSQHRYKLVLCNFIFIVFYLLGDLSDKDYLILFNNDSYRKQKKD